MVSSYMCCAGATSHGSSSAHGYGGMAVQYQVTHETMAEPVLSLPWGLHHTAMPPGLSWPGSCHALLVGGQAVRLEGKVDNFTVCQSMKSPLTGTVATWVVALPHLPPLWVLPFLPWGGSCCRSHRGHPLSSKGLAILQPHCFLPCSDGGKDKGMEGCRKILAR